MGVPVVIGGDNLPSLVEIRLTDLPNIWGASGPPGPPGSGITVKKGDFIVPVKVNHCHFGSQNGFCFDPFFISTCQNNDQSQQLSVTSFPQQHQLLKLMQIAVSFYSLRELYDIRIICISTKYSECTWPKFLTLIVTLCNIRKTPIQVKTRQMHETKSGRGYEKKQMLDTSDSKAEVLSLYVVLKFT